jgi:hypothetical protein
MSLPSGDMQFYDHAIPALPVGTYQIQVSHDIVGVTDANIPDQTQQFIVRGPRFSLPANQVYSLFPPDNSSGSYEEKLPQIIFTSRVLPWELELSGMERNVPWMALLVLQENEITGGDPKSSTKSLASTVANVFNDIDSSIIKPDIPIASISDEEQQALCQTVIVDGAVFQQILPTSLELPYLAHCREVNLDQKAVTTHANNGLFSILLSSRFPWVQNVAQEASGKNIVHLVSLEGFEAYLSEKPPAIPTGKKVRLFSLASWSFICLPDGGQTFSALVANLAAAGNATLDCLRLKLPVDAPTDTSNPAHIVQDYLARGYVGLNYEVQTGESSFALYRGPLTPDLPGTIQKSQPFYSPAAATIYDARIGVFDLSLAVAWQIGRSLALADQHFSTRMLDFRNKGHAIVDLLHEYLAYANLDTTASYSRIVQSNLVHNMFIDLLRTDILTDVGTIAQGSRQTTGTATQNGTTRSVASDPITILRELLGQADVQQTLAQATVDDIEPIATWLGRLKLLYTVPFHHLVPDPQLLPVESIRFCYFDYNWIEALYDGAVSIGMQTSRDVLYQGVMNNVLSDAVDLVVLQMRAKLLGKSIDQSTQPANTDTPIAGLLIRSALVSGWPGLTIHPTQNNAPLSILRMDRLAPDILFCLFLGIPDAVTLSEPQEGLQFGVDDLGQLDLRAVSGTTVGTEIGVKWQIFDVDKQRPLDTYRRPGTDRVLKIHTTVGQDLVTDLQTQIYSKEALTSSSFALQMISAPEQIRFA